MPELSVVHAMEAFNAMGFEVTAIPTAAPAQRADLRVTWGDHEEYIVEAKLREPSAAWKELLAAAREQGTAHTTRPVRSWSALRAMARKAYQQLISTPARDDAFRLLWWVAPHDEGDFVVACLEKCLNGVEPLTVVADLEAPPSMLDCYYHSPNCFEQCPQLAGAVLAREAGGRLVVNSFYSKPEQFRNSNLYKRFASVGAVVDPEEDAKVGKVLMLGRDFAGPRDGHTQWNYLREKYGVLTSVALDSQFNGVLSIARSLLEPEDEC